MDKTKDASAVRKIADLMRREITNIGDGQFLGSETELVDRLGVSRPTFRQAAKLLEHEQLLLIKRGVGGGFFSKLPTASAVSHMAAVFLQSRRTTLEHAMRAARPLFIETARLAAARQDRATAQRLKAFLAKDAETPMDNTDQRTFLRIEREFGEVFAPASGNPVLELFVTVLFSFSTFLAESIYAGHAERIPAYRSLRNNLVTAMLDGDEEIAGILALRRSDAMLEWLKTDSAKRRKTTPLLEGAMRKGTEPNR
jgi:GntR family transcriptional repressor for pyruvate dehydrogenase complex